MHAFLQDFRYALRQLRNAPAFAITAILTLALGIGANTAIFSLLDQALLRALPVHDPKSLVILEGTGKAWDGHSSSYGGDQEAYFSYPMYRDLRDHSTVFDGLIATSRAEAGFTRAGASQMVDAETVSGNYFSTLGVQPALGRLFAQSDDTQPGANPVAVVSFDFWKSHLGADPRIVGETISINSHPFQVVGVSALRFRSAIWGESPAVFVPMSMLGVAMPGKESRLTNHRDRWMNIVGRLKPGVTREQAATAMQPLWYALRADELKALGTRSKRFTDEYLTRSRMLVLPGARGFSYDRENYQTPLLAVMAMATLVLLIATVNIASLLLVRSANRMRDFSLRYALGANAGRIVQQLLLEGLVIGVVGGAAGLLLANVAIRALVHRLANSDGTGDFAAAIDTRLLIFNFAVALAVSLFFSLAPVLQLRRPNLSAVLGQRNTTGSGALLSFRRVVVCLQIGLSVVLIVGAGLFVRTMQKLRSIDVGFNTTHLIGFGINPQMAGYAPAAVPGIEQQVLETLRALPGVQSVAATDQPELTGDDHGGNITIQGYTPAPDENIDVEKSAISEDYFASLEVPLLAGRYFNSSDDGTHPLVAIVNQAFAKKFCRDAESCLGKRIADGGGDKVKLDTEIVGVVRDIKHTGLREPVVETCFRPLRQQTPSGGTFFYLRTYADPEQSLSLVRQGMHQLDAKLVLYKLGTMDAQIEEDLSNDRLVLLLAVSFGVLAALLSSVGIYGVLAYSTTQRTREIGIRIALGSSRLAISRIILADVLLLAGLGIVVALPVAYGLTRLIKSELFGVSPADPMSLVSAVVLVTLVAIIAALIPAQRAATIDPTKALRTE